MKPFSMKTFLPVALILLSSCAVTKTSTDGALTSSPGPTPPPVIPAEPAKKEITLEELLSIPQEKFPLRGWDSNYDEAIRLAVRAYPNAVPCNDPVLFWKSVTLPESGFNRRSTYREPPPLGYDSLGLLQLSLEDESWAKCGLRTREDVYHPIRNLYCGVKILNRLQKKFPGKSIYFQGGQYWAVLRNPENWPKRTNFNGLKRFKEAMAKGGCPL